MRLTSYESAWQQYNFILTFSLFIERLTSLFLSFSFGLFCTSLAVASLLLFRTPYSLPVLPFMHHVIFASFIPSTWFLFPESVDCSDSTGDHFALKLCTVLKHRMTFHFVRIRQSSHWKTIILWMLPIFFHIFPHLICIFNKLEIENHLKIR